MLYFCMKYIQYMENLFSTVDNNGQVTLHQGISKNSNDIHGNASKFPTVYGLRLKSNQKYSLSVDIRISSYQWKCECFTYYLNSQSWLIIKKTIHL